MGCRRIRRAVVVPLSLLLLAAVAACTPAPPPPAAAPAEKPAPPAAAPPEIQQGDPSTATNERAAPPTLQPVVLGKFKPGSPAAESGTGPVEIEDGKITGGNGASFTTERVALVNGDDQYSAGQRYADAMMIEPRQQVELRHVVDQTPPKDPATAFCGATPTGYLAIAMVMEGDREVVKLIALSGEGIPAASAQGVKLCTAAVYQSDKK